MPQVPTYQKQVQTQQLPNMKVDTTISKEQLGVGEAFNKMTHEAEQIALQAKKEADHAAVRDAETELNKMENSFFYGENGQGGAYTKQGKDALGLKGQMDKVYQDVYQKQLESLSNDAQKSLFEARAGRRKMAMDDSIMRHMSVETTRYLDKSSDDFVKNEIGSAIQNMQNPNRVNESIVNINDELNKYADRKGYDNQSRKLLIDNAMSTVHTGIINRMVKNGDDAVAQDYFNKVKGQIGGEHLAQVESALEISSTLGFAQKFTDEALRKGWSEKQTLNEAVKIDDTKKRDAAEKRTVHVFSMEKQAKAEYQQSIFEQATNYFDETGGKVDPVMLSRMEAATRVHFKNYTDRNPVLDDSKTYTDLYQIAMNPATRQKFVDHELIYEKGNLNKEHYEKLLKLQQDIKSGKLDPMKKLNGEYSNSEIAFDVYALAGNPKDKKSEQYKKFSLTFSDAVERYKTANNKQYISNEEARTIANQLVIEDIDTGKWFGGKSAIFQLKFKDIPESSVKAIKESLIKSNRPSDDDEVLKEYQRIRYSTPRAK